MTFGVTYNLAVLEYLISRLIGGNANPTPFLTSFLSVVLPSIRRDIFCGGNMNLKYS
jgi:hypothetical protein